MWELLSLQPSLLNQLSTLLGIGTIFRTCHGVIATPFELQCLILITLNLGQIVPHFCIIAFPSEVSIVPTKYVSLDPG